MVAAHDINNNSHKDEKSAALCRHRALKHQLSSGFNIDDLAVLVKTAGGAHPMGHTRRRALRANTQLGQF